MVDMTLYDAVGGHATFVRLVETFYRNVAADPVLRRIHPDDLTGPTERMTWFLEQYWGGPRSYSERRGHPALRVRHAGLRLDREMRERWLSCMTRAIDDLGLPDELAVPVREQMDRTAHFLRNVPADQDGPGLAGHDAGSGR